MSTAFIDAVFDSQGGLFAGIFPGLDSHRLRVVPTSAANAALAQDFSLDPQTKVSTLTWTSLPGPDRQAQQKKRRKDAPIANKESSEVVALGTTQGTVLIYQPASASITTTLSTGSSAPVSDIMSEQGKLFVLQNDGTLTEFDLSKFSLLVSNVLPVQDATSLANTASPFIVGNTCPNELKNNEVDMVYNGFATPIAEILTLNPHQFAALSREDRQVFVYEVGQPKPVRLLSCPNTDAVSMSTNEDASIVAVVSEDGNVHVFDLSAEPAKANGRSRGRSTKSVAHLTPKFTISVTLAKKGTPLPVYRTKFVGPTSLLLAWPEQGSVPVFDTVSWDHANTEGIRLEKLPAAPLAQEHLVGGVDPAAAPQFVEDKAKVVSGADMGELDNPVEDVGSDDETLADRLESLEVELNSRAAKPVSNGHKNEPNGNHERSDRRLRRKELELKLSQPGSFATLLSQALRLNDKQLLEICLEESNPAMIKTSIVKLEPALAATLLENLASNAARSLNRSGTLAQWIRWTVVIQGAYLVTLPNLLKTLAGLHSTLSTRAQTLPRLLALQGRLELLEEQISVRSEFAAAQAAAEDDADEPEAYYDEDEVMIVNGEEANDEIESDDDGDEDDEDVSESESEDESDGSDNAEIAEDDEILLSE